MTLFAIKLPLASYLAVVLVASTGGCSQSTEASPSRAETTELQETETRTKPASFQIEPKIATATEERSHDAATDVTATSDDQPAVESTIESTSDPTATEKGDTVRHALLVGVSKYYPDSFPPLPGAQRDITELAKVLTSKGFDKDHLALLTNDAGNKDPRCLPLSHNIRKRLRKLAKQTDGNDAIVVALAGHGVQPKGGKYYFCPFDADLEDAETLISIEEIYSLMEKCPGQFKLLMIDACREATTAKIAGSSTQVQLPSPPHGMATFVSCSQGELAYERQDGELSHGVFFHAVIQGLSGEATADDGTVTVPDLERYVKKKVESYVRDTYQASQNPVLQNNTAGLFSIVHFTANDEQIERARWLVTRDRYREAAELIETILKQSPENGVALAERSRIATYAAEQMGDTSDLSVPEADARRSIELAPRESTPYVAMANVKRLRKEYEQALTLCNQALSQDPNDVQAHIIKAMTLYGMGDLDGMGKESLTALEIAPTHPEARGIYAGFLYADGQYDAGHAELDRAIALMPDLPTLYFLKGYGYEQQGEHHKAVKQYTSAIRLNDNVPSYYVRRALSLGNSGDYPAAWEDVAAAETLAPTYFDVTSARAMLLVNQQKWQEALVALNKGLKINPDSPDLLMGRGFAYVYTQQFAKGEVDLQRMVELKPEASQGHLGLAVIDFYQSRLDEALTHIQRSIRYNERSSEANYILAAIYMKRQDFKNALAPLSNAIELDPKNAVYYQQRAMIYQLLGRSSEAQSDQRKFQELSK
ncbi:MAG: tetratricopeptide repeat protein [Planctomycetota bacterium]